MLPVFNPLDDNPFAFVIKQNPVITGAQAIADIRILQPLNIAVQTEFQARDLPYDLSGETRWQGSQIVNRGFSVINPHGKPIL